MSSANNFEYRGWLVSVEIGASEHGFCGHGDLRSNGTHRCRVMLKTPRGDWRSALWALDGKARDFVDE
jgi:hypothetical protein